MARGHWLDPLARQILRATEQLANPRRILFQKQVPKSHEIEKELHALKQKQKTTPLINRWTVDVNRAKPEEWRKLTGCSDDMVDLLIRLQKGGVQLSGMDDLVQLLELPKEIADKWSPHLIFRWYGTAPELESNASVNLNSASLSILKKTLKWPEWRLERLTQERKKRGFDNLADFQERMILPASVIESLIGKVHFGSKLKGSKLKGSKLKGPKLPPKPKQ